MKPSVWLLASLATAATVSVASCSSSRNGDGGGGPGGGRGDASNQSDSPTGDDAGDGGAVVLPFNPDSPGTYASKVKDLLVGLPLTQQELEQVTTDSSPPAQLGQLVDTWMGSTSNCAPSATQTCASLYQTKMLRFFELAFQQTQVAEQDFENQLNPGQLQMEPNTTLQPFMVQNQQQVFARTMLSITGAAPPQPFNTSMTTSSYSMTTAMMAFYALTDAYQLDNDVQGSTDFFQKAYPNQVVTVESTEAITAADSASTTSGHFMTWYDPTLQVSGTGSCATATKLTYSQGPGNGGAGASRVWYVLNGVYSADDNGCTGTGQSQFTSPASSPAVEPNDFDDWKTVSIGQPSGAGTQPLGSGTTAFFDLANLRSASTTSMTLVRPYLSFFTTPAFFANWQTNSSNQMRVTTNQALIVATGQAISPNDPTDAGFGGDPPGLDHEHAVLPACQACHEHLDPTRSILASTFSWYYGQQTNLPAVVGPDGGTIDEPDGAPYNWQGQPGRFIFEGVDQVPTSIYDFGTILSTHPLFAQAWVQKLCYYFDSQACVANGSDAVFNGLVTQFGNGFSWSALVKAILVSPLTTYATTTVTATTSGETVAVARRDHLCAALDARLGFADVCNLNALKGAELPTTAEGIVPGFPSDGYGRGSGVPVLPNDPTLFYRGGTENFCEAIAQIVVDSTNAPAGVQTWKSADCDVGTMTCSPDGGGLTCGPVSDFVTLVAGIPFGDERFCPVYEALLQDFVNNKVEGGATATTALQSTFTAACMAPSAISIGL